MPCRCDYMEDNSQYQKAADASTRAACDMRTVLRKYDLEQHLTVETRVWIHRHDRADAKRIAEETANGLRQSVKQQALNKLSLEERRVLGL